MNLSIHKISILRIVDRHGLLQKVPDQEYHYTSESFCRVKYENGAYTLLDNPEYYAYLHQQKASKIPIGIETKEIATIRDHLLLRTKKEILNPMMSAIIFDELSTVGRLKQRQIAETLGITQGAISNKRRLNSLPVFVQNEIIKEKIKERHGRAILQLKDRDDFEKQALTVLQQVIENNLNVGQTEDIVYEILGKPKINRKSLNIKNLDDIKTLAHPESKLVINHVDKELNQAISQINKYFPNLKIELDEGIDKEDYVFLLKLKGISK